MQASRGRRAVTTVLLVALGAAVVYWRCNQLRSRGDELTQQALDTLWQVIAAGSQDFEPAIEAFEAAARHQLAAGYALFCLSAVRELQGEPAGSPPVGWMEAVDEIRRGNLEAARAAFESLGYRSPRYDLYLRLIEDLEARARR